MIIFAFEHDYVCHLPAFPSLIPLFLPSPPTDSVIQLFVLASWPHTILAHGVSTSLTYFPSWCMYVVARCPSPFPPPLPTPQTHTQLPPPPCSCPRNTLPLVALAFTATSSYPTQPCVYLVYWSQFLHVDTYFVCFSGNHRSSYSRSPAGASSGCCALPQGSPWFAQLPFSTLASSPFSPPFSPTGAP